MIKREINLPFPGFYYTIYSDAIDHAEEMEAEWRAEREVEDAREAVKQREAKQKAFPFADRSAVEVDETQLVTAPEFAELFFDHCKYSKVYEKVARFYVEAFGIWMKREAGFPADALAFVEMISPREYNFTTDRIFATITEEAIQLMWKRSVEDKHETLARIIRERFTSCDGFLSFYRNDLESWLAKPLEDWDHNELGTLLVAHIELCDGYTDRFEMDLYELTFSGNGEEDEARDAGMDWPAYEKALAELREKKKAQVTA